MTCIVRPMGNKHGVDLTNHGGEHGSQAEADDVKDKIEQVHSNIECPRLGKDP